MRYARAGMKRYMASAMRKAKFYELDATGWCANIPRFHGLIGRGATKSACRMDLRKHLDNWVIENLERRDRLPVVDGLKLSMS